MNMKDEIMKDKKGNKPNFINIIIEIIKIILININKNKIIGGSEILKTQQDILIKYFKYKKKYLLLKNKIFNM